jgi:hypothetical protein
MRHNAVIVVIMITVSCCHYIMTFPLNMPTLSFYHAFNDNVIVES